MPFLLLFVAFGAGVLGLLLLSQATSGVGLIAFGCLLGIAARMAQAHTHARPAPVAAPAPLAPVEPLPHRVSDRALVIGTVVVMTAVALLALAYRYSQGG